MKIASLICARGGSKKLPGKNIRLLDGKPLIAHAINVIKRTKLIDRIIVSTDSDEIASVARHYGAEVPFIRPQELSRDNSPEWHVWQHAIEHLKKTDEYEPDILIVVPTTAPLRIPKDLKNCIDKYKDNNYDLVVTVTDSHRNPYFNMVKENKDKTVELVLPNKNSINRRQDAPVIYDMTTVAYVMSPKYLKKSNGLFEGRVGYVHVPTERAIDIDSAFDFKMAEYIISLKDDN
jgi:CMP-N-acetylneuraminic acid synthetase